MQSRFLIFNESFKILEQKTIPKGIKNDLFPQESLAVKLSENGL